MTWSIHHVNLPAHDVRETVAFFRDILGMTEGQFHRPPGNAGNFRSDPAALAVFGEQNRGLHIVKPVPSFARDNNLLHNPTIGGHVAITVADLDAVRRKLDAAGFVYSDAGEYAMAGYRQIYLHDPSMNLIEINQPVG
jgi:catechol 2,3-dioxygenase-like lactoylglutathione lyase family enzyme